MIDLMDRNPADEEAEPSSAPRRRRRAWIVAAVAAVFALVATGRALVAASNGDAKPNSMLAPAGVLDLDTVSAGIAAEFRFAHDHQDHYRQLRCWCGCEAAFDHRSLADCFVRPDGRWEAHGAGCGVCIAEAATARQRLTAGVPITAIAAELDDTYGPTELEDPT